MANVKKMTKADYFKQIMASYPLTEDEKAFVEHELELLAKKNSAEKKPTAVRWQMRASRMQSSKPWKRARSTLSLT